MPDLSGIEMVNVVHYSDPHCKKAEYGKYIHIDIKYDIKYLM